jgi:hypothetical protein
MRRFLRGVALSVFIAAGCGDSTSTPATGGPSPQADRFVGTWTVASGQVTAACGTLALPPADIHGQQTVERGTSSDLLFTVEPTCKLQLDVNGDTATARPNQQCQLTVPYMGSMLPVTGTVTAGTLTLDASGNNATFDCMGTVQIVSSCTFAIHGMSTKSP